MNVDDAIVRTALAVLRSGPVTPFVTSLASRRTTNPPTEEMADFCHLAPQLTASRVRFDGKLEALPTSRREVWI